MIDSERDACSEFEDIREKTTKIHSQICNFFGDVNY